MPSPDFKLVALDVDGTILDSAGRISSSFIDVVAQLSTLGVYTVLCTGRRWRTAFATVRQIRSAHPIVICCGGALIKDAARDTSLYVRPIVQAVSRRAVAAFRDAGLVPFVLVDRPFTCRELLIAEQDRRRAEELPYIIANQDAVEYYAGEFPDVGDEALVVYTLDHISRVAPAEVDIRKSLGTGGTLDSLRQYHFGPGQTALEVHAIEATKWNALNWLLAQLSIPPRAVIAIGDDVNDIPMLRMAGLSFAMGNAKPEVKSVATRVTSSNDEDGVAEALRSVFRL